MGSISSKTTTSSIFPATEDIYTVDKQISRRFTANKWQYTDPTATQMRKPGTLWEMALSPKSLTVLKKDKKEETREEIFMKYPNLEDMVDFVREAVQEIYAAKDDDIAEKTMNNTTLELLVALDQVLMKECEAEEERNVVADELSESNGGQVLVEYIKVLTENGSNTPTQGHDADCVHFAKLVCLNYTDQSMELAGDLGRMGMFPMLVSDLVNFRDEVDDYVLRGTVIHYSISILHNCAKNPDNRKYMGDAKALDAIIPYTKVDYQELKMIAIMTAAYIIEEKDNDKIIADGSIIDFILVYLENSLKDSNDMYHRYKGFSAHEIVSGIMHLASNDDNKLRVVKHGVLPYLSQLLKIGTYEEKEISARTIWVLAFKDENKTAIRQMETLMEMMRDLATNSSDTNAKGALWVLENEERLKKIKMESEYGSSSGLESGSDVTESEEKSTSNGEKKSVQTEGNIRGHVMISYSWRNQALMLRVKDRLEKNKYRVWMDLYEMRGSKLQGMAEAVEGSSVVLICMSRAYKNSPDCRTEGEYAYQLGKYIIPIKIEANYMPDGWLGALQGAKIYIDFSNQMSFDVMFTRLLQELGDRGKSDDVQHDGLPLQLLEQPTSVPPFESLSIIRKVRRKPVNTWTKEDVLGWATKNKILSRKVQNLNGECIAFLSSMKTSAPEFFFRYVSEKLEVKELPDLICLNRGLENLEL